ncbi:MAG: prepilin-type N-terminal cleavage/methylation domain-containing protein [Chitinispirillia bacterium]|jgi:prepilin-type N-terminal cleavage/methylation domain-containing protein
MDKKQKVNKKGFTLIELMIVIVIIGILAAVAIPKFTKAQYKATVSEFPTILTQIYTAEGAYEAELNTFIACPAGQYGAQAWLDLGVSIPVPAVPANANFQYAVVPGAGGIASSFIAQAENVNFAIGVVPQNTIAQIDEGGVKTANAWNVYAPNWQ